MSLSWHQRKSRLAALLKGGGDEDDEGIALDRLTHGQNVIGKTSKTMEIDSLRFSNRDLEVVGTLEVGQFGVIDLVTCRFNNCVYVRKSIEKLSALRTREQCSPQVERDLLLQATKTQSPWAPHLLCAFQTPTHLSLLMDYAEGGTLWDVLESSPYDGRILETDLQWWIPQAVNAIHWCHSQGFAHRDVKPHNFVLTSDAHLLLIDFGSAAPLLSPNDDGSQRLPRQYCLIPCGTCDYISPEILQAHEEALVALEMEEEDNLLTSKSEEAGEYGLETDWWSLGVLVYEMAYGVAPFFAPDIRSTYLRIMSHEKSLKFDKNITISHELQHFLRRLLTHATKRLGRHNVMEITEHAFFDSVDWGNLPTQAAPVGLHLPRFIYSEPKASTAPAPATSEQSEDAHSQGFPFSALFQSSSASPGLSILRPSPEPNSNSSRSSATSFIGFSWGPTIGAFPEEIPSTNSLRASLLNHGLSTPRTIVRSPIRFHQTLAPTNLDVPLPLLPGQIYLPPESGCYSTPLKPYAISPHSTLPRTSTIRRTAPRRGVSDREAMKQLVDCVGMSARKKVLESGRKPNILNIFSSKVGKKDTTRKELRFDELARPIPGLDYTNSTSLKETSRSRSHSRTNSTSRSLSRMVIGQAEPSNLRDKFNDHENSFALPDNNADINAYSSAETTDSEGAPPSPSPSPRPGSALSTMSMTTFSRQSATPTASGFLGSTRRRATSASVTTIFQPPSLGDGSVMPTTAPTAASAMTTSGQLKVPPTSTKEVFADSLPEGQTDPEYIYTNVDVVDSHHFAGDNWAEQITSDDHLDELGERYGKIMSDIRHLERRLDQFLSFVEN